MLDRIAADGADVRRPLDERESIVGHLQSLLNSRRGQTVTLPGYGVYDFVDLVHSFPQATQILQRSIRETILEHEPRLKNVRVRHVPNPHEELVLRFEITGQLAREGRRQMLRLRTEVNHGGVFEVG